jgi:hypothetical protein
LAVTYGYQVEVLKGYFWEERSDLFSKYVKTLYEHRLSFPKTDPRNTICKLLLNSLYGKFGMSPVITEYEVLAIDQPIESALMGASDLTEVGGVSLIGRNIIKNQYSEWKSAKESKVLGNNNKDFYKLLEISTPIAVFTTAYARMLMAEYKIKYADHLYYSDTDSLVLDCPLPDHMVGDQLGQFKLEHMVSEGIFLAPKVYGLLLPSGRVIIKNKGYIKDDITLDHLKFLLNKDSSLALKQEKWFKDLGLGGINIHETPYTLRATSNKREFIYKDGVIIDTKPFVL